MYLHKLEPDFLGKLLLQTEKRADESPQFAKALVAGAKSLNDHWNGILEIARGIADTPGIQVPETAVPERTLEMDEGTKVVVIGVAWVRCLVLRLGLGVHARLRQAATAAIARAVRDCGGAHLSGRESGDAVLEGHHTGRVGGECTATRVDGYQA